MAGCRTAEMTLEDVRFKPTILQSYQLNPSGPWHSRLPFTIVSLARFGAVLCVLCAQSPGPTHEKLVSDRKAQPILCARPPAFGVKAPWRVRQPGYQRRLKASCEPP